MIRTFIVVLVGYVFDVAPSFEQGMMTIRRFFTDQSFSGFVQSIQRLIRDVSYMFTGKDVPVDTEILKLGLTWKDLVLLAVCVVVIWTVSMIQEKHSDTTMRDLLDKKPFILRFVLYFICIMTIIVFGIYGSGYAASDFVYMQL